MWSVRINERLYDFNDFESAYQFARLHNGEPLCLQYKPV